MNKQELLQARKKAYSLYARKGGTEAVINQNVFRSIGRETGLTPEEVKFYMTKDKWKERFTKAKKSGKIDNMIKQGIKEVKHQPETEKGRNEQYSKIDEILEESDLTDRNKLFVLYYLKSYNAKWSAIQSGYPSRNAGIRGHELLRDERVKEALTQIRGIMHNSIFITAHDVVEQYVKIAFSDITDYVEFDGQNVSLKNSEMVDGQLIEEISQGKDGVKVKMHNKMKALERLEKLFEIMPDRKLELDREKFEFAKEQTRKAENGEGSGQITIINDIG